MYAVPFERRTVPMTETPTLTKPTWARAARARVANTSSTVEHGMKRVLYWLHLLPLLQCFLARSSHWLGADPSCHDVYELYVTSPPGSAADLFLSKGQY